MFLLIFYDFQEFYTKFLLLIYGLFSEMLGEKAKIASIIVWESFRINLLNSSRVRD